MAEEIHVGLPDIKDIGQRGWSVVFKRHLQFLLDRMDPDSGLLDRLLERDVLSFSQRDSIKAKKTINRRNAKLLEIIHSMDKYGDLIDALKSSKQTHISNYLAADGKQKADLEGDWPLTDKEVAIFTKNYSALIELLEISDFINHVFSNGVVNRKQRDGILSKSTADEKNETFIEILRRRSLRDYAITIRCLRLSNQGHVADILEKGGVAIRVDFTVAGVKENDVVTRINSMLLDYSPTEKYEILRELVELNCIAAVQGHSVSLYFKCLNSDDVDRLQQVVDCGRLVQVFTTAVNQLFDSSVQISVKLKRTFLEKFHLTEDKFTRSRRRLKDFNSNDDVDKAFSRYFSITTVNQLPFELLDIILQKTYVSTLRAQNEDLPTYLTNNEIIARLASVNLYWFQRLMKQRLKISVMRQIIEYYGKQGNRKAFIRNNRCYLQSYLQPSYNLIKRLKSTDCITDLQAASSFRKRQNLSKERVKFRHQNCAMELFEIARKIDEARHLVFIQCLQQRTMSMSARTKRIATLIDNDGVLLKSVMKSSQRAEAESYDSSLVQRLNLIQDKGKPKSHEVSKLLQQLRENDVEVLEASLDRDIICWVWCKSENGLSTLQQPHPIEGVENAFTELVKTLIGRFRMNIDHESFEKTIVLFSIVCFNLKLDFKEPTPISRVKGISKLRSKIYVLCEVDLQDLQEQSAIYVFEDSGQFHLMNKIELNMIRDSKDIGSSECDNCLYVTDFDEFCVWKITGNSSKNQQKNHRILRWLETGTDFAPSTLSVSSAGQVLMVSGGRPYTLRVYGSDAKVRRSVPLPEHIISSRHALETRNGKFLLLHQSWVKEEGKEGIRPRDQLLWVVSELNEDGDTIRQFIPINKEHAMFDPDYLSACCCEMVLVADPGNRRVILLDSNLKWKRVLVPTEKGNNIRQGESDRIIPRRFTRLVYDDEKKQLIVGGGFMRGHASVYTVTGPI